MSKTKEMVQKVAPEYGVDPDLVMAIIQIESGGKQWATRFEPAWRYPLDIAKWAKHLGQTEETERTHQATSWGLMQVMGAVARELGFTGYLTQLCNGEVGVRCGCLKLQSLFKKYKDQNDVISAYNQGNNRRGESGNYVNQGYVDKVLAALKPIQAN